MNNYFYFFIIFLPFLGLYNFIILLSFKCLSIKELKYFSLLVKQLFYFIIVLQGLICGNEISGIEIYKDFIFYLLFLGLFL